MASLWTLSAVWSLSKRRYYWILMRYWEVNLLKTRLPAEGEELGGLLPVDGRFWLSVRFGLVLMASFPASSRYIGSFLCVLSSAELLLISFMPSLLQHLFSRPSFPSFFFLNKLVVSFLPCFLSVLLLSCRGLLLLGLEMSSSVLFFAAYIWKWIWALSY